MYFMYYVTLILKLSSRMPARCDTQCKQSTGRHSQQCLLCYILTCFGVSGQPLLLLLLSSSSSSSSSFSAIEFSLGGSSPYTSNKYE